MKRANSGIISGDLVDTISSLPDSTLSFILSLMPTKNAVATSVLSKRWKSVWKSVHNLEFKLDLCIPYCYKRRHEDCIKEPAGEEDMKFASSVNHVLVLHDGGFLNRFSLVWKPTCIPSQINSWITTVVSRNVQELYLCVDNSNEPFEIPSSVFSCETLTSLVLDGNMLVTDSITVSLPRLESIELDSVYFKSDEAFQQLISGCPVLDYLSIDMDMDIMTEYLHSYRGDTEINLFTYIISSTSLTEFTLNVESDTDFFESVPYCSVELEAPSLEYLHLEGFIAKIFVRGSLSSVYEAEFSLSMSADEISDANICNSLVEAIRTFDCVEFLTLSENLLSALSRATIGLSTKFNRLTELSIGANCCYCSAIQDFIQSSDNLEVLIVKKKIDCQDSGENHTHSNWTTPVGIPRCLSNSLKTVEIGDYGGFDYERERIRYMLMYGRVLEVMTITCNIKSSDVKLGLLEEICDFPRKSPACRVKFIGRNVESI